MYNALSSRAMSLRHALMASSILASGFKIAAETKQEAELTKEQKALIWAAATKLLMTGPRATPPRRSTVRRFIRTKAFMFVAVNPHTGYRWGSRIPYAKADVA